MNQEYAAITPKWVKKHLENIKFKKLLPDTRLNLIKLNSNITQSMCNISKAIYEYTELLIETQDKKDRNNLEMLGLSGNL